MSSSTVSVFVDVDVNINADLREVVAHIRHVILTADLYSEMYRIGSAIIFADATARPAFREIIDNLHWEEIR